MSVCDRKKDFSTDKTSTKRFTFLNKHASKNRHFAKLVKQKEEVAVILTFFSLKFQLVSLLDYLHGLFEMHIKWDNFQFNSGSWIFRQISRFRNSSAQIRLLWQWQYKGFTPFDWLFEVKILKFFKYVIAIRSRTFVLMKTMINRKLPIWKYNDTHKWFVFAIGFGLRHNNK